MLECGLELHKDKTKIVYCKDDKRKGNHPIVKFDFLGFSFQPRSTFSRKQGKLFLGYDCAISIKSKKQIADKLEELDIIKCSFRSIVGIAYYLNPYIRGWVNYYGKFRISALNPIFQLLQRRILRWARKRYKRYKTSLKRAGRWLKRMRKQFPYLFYHWKLGF
jgi:RNA-directed DNA polymerase